MVFSMWLWHHDGTKGHQSAPGCRKRLIAQDCGIFEKGGLRHPGAGNALLEMRREKSRDR
jgi:hypothetical protein